MDLLEFLELVGVGVVLGFIGYLCLNHRHKWEIRATNQGKNSDGFSCTAILHTCACGECKSEVIQGHWNVEDFTAMSDRDFAKQIGVKL